ncbi:hypothetical protein L3Q82_012271 [Scortum barcoo]|uniref:Uncharacterized protein n=1 Tax=Scortum barcoo TaxID=214431 RepID=A0ACB8W4J6_9TELE|nr:hypothetical protein L3Q82_012271 [Scortum barcoo]
MDRCNVCCSLVDIDTVRSGEEGAEPEGKALDLLVHLRFQPSPMVMSSGYLRDRVRSLDIRERLRVEPPLLLHIERSQLRWFGHLCKDASRTPPCGGVSGMSIREETLGQTQDTLEGLYLSTVLGTPQGSPWRSWLKWLEERTVWASLLRMLPLRPRPG